ncbi:MAG: hypothetical protein FJY65_07085 [Calditrichaeota bacterium]|nr:hypothetical protein [Calditrichota bacterium]
MNYKRNCPAFNSILQSGGVNLYRPVKIAIIFSWVIFCSCGVYSFSGRGISGIKTIAVEAFDNRTAEFGIREQIADAIITKLLTDRTLTITNASAADALMRGTIVAIDDKPLTFQADESVTERQIIITVEITIVKPGRSDPIWQQRLTGEGRYSFKTGAPDERQAGIVKAIEQIVQDLLNQLTSDW